MTPEALDCSVIIPTVGRPGLQTLVDSLATPPCPREVIVVDDRSARRRRRAGRLRLSAPDQLPTRVVAGPARGPAAARNVGLRLAHAPWVVFLDDDVQIDPQWTSQLAADLAQASNLGAVGVQGRLVVPLPTDRRPTDWERQVAGLAGAAWITADMAYRRDVLLTLGGFDERFPRAYREDAELAARLRVRGCRLIRGGRRTIHPVGAAGPWVSLRRQAGNADDALLRRLYGPQWRILCGAPPGRRPRHALVTAAGAMAALAWLTGARRPAALAGLAWLAGTAEFAARRIAPGPRTAREVATMAVTSVAIPPLAVGHYLYGWLRHRGARPIPAATTADVAGDAASDGGAGATVNDTATAPTPAEPTVAPASAGGVTGTAPSIRAAAPAPTGKRALPAPTGKGAAPTPTGKGAAPAPTGRRAVAAPASRAAATAPTDRVGVRA